MDKYMHVIQEVIIDKWLVEEGDREQRRGRGQGTMERKRVE